MDRSEAINFLKELLRNYMNMPPEAVSFEKLTGYQGFTVRIKDTLQENDKQIVRNIAKKYCLAVKEEENQILIFKPK